MHSSKCIVSIELSRHFRIVSNLSSTASSVMLSSVGQISDDKLIVFESCVIVSSSHAVACRSFVILGENFTAKCIRISFAEYNFVCKKLNLSKRLQICVESGSC